MTDLARVVFSPSSLLFLVTMLAGGCGSSPGLCPCPLGGAMIEVPGNVAEVSAPLPCSASAVTTDVVLVGRDGAGSCQVRIQLTDGTTYTSSVQFTGGSGCCPYTYHGIAGPLDRIDAGSGGD
jgi:hypothetical protein